jgi:hypothetical protein
MLAELQWVNEPAAPKSALIAHKIRFMVSLLVVIETSCP